MGTWGPGDFLQPKKGFKAKRRRVLGSTLDRYIRLAARAGTEKR